MCKFPLTIVLVLAGLLLSGCASSPWSGERPALGLLSKPAPVRSTASTAPSAASDQPDTQKMQDVMAELRQLGTLDPVAQDQLLEDLRQSDPSLWPLVMQQFRATAAYRRRAMERTAAVKQRAERLPPVDDVAIAPVETPQEKYPRTSDPPPEAEPPANQASNQVLPASYTVPENTNRLAP